MRRRRHVPRTLPAIDPHADTIRRWLTEDKVVHRKQRHTARRIWERLVDEQGADVAESTVRRFIRECRRELDLVHHDVADVAHHLPGEEAEVVIIGELTRVAVFELLRISHPNRAIAGWQTLMARTDCHQLRRWLASIIAVVPLAIRERIRYELSACICLGFRSGIGTARLSTSPSSSARIARSSDSLPV